MRAKKNTMKTITLLTALLLATLASLHAAELPALLDAPSWKALTTTVPEARKPAAFDARKEDGLRFSLSGGMAQSKLMRWERPWTEGELAAEQFVVLDYRAWWLAVQRPYTEVLTLTSMDAAGKSISTPLVTTPDLICDGQWHRLLMKRAYPSKPTALRVALESRVVSEVFLLLAAELPSRELDYFIGHSPTTLDNVEQFAVELVYESGIRDWAFPYSILDGHHLIRRALGVYAVPATGAKLKEVVLHNRKLGARVHLAAMTVNTGKARRFPALADEPQRQLTKTKPLDDVIKPFVQRRGDLLTLGNAHYELTLDAEWVLTPVAVQHRRLSQGAARVYASPLLEMKVAGKAIPAQQWKLDSVKPSPLGFVVTYTSTEASLPLRCEVTLKVDVTGGFIPARRSPRWRTTGECGDSLPRAARLAAWRGR